MLTILSSIVGVAAGAVQGYFGGWVDLVVQRFMEIWSGLPTLYHADHPVQHRGAQASGGCSILLLLSAGCSLVDLVRAEFLRARNFDFVRAARALGASNLAIMWRHVLPNAMVSTLTFMPFILIGSITHADLARLPRIRPAARARRRWASSCRRARTT